MAHIHIDFETRSTVDLTRTTADVYAKDPTTDIWCLAWAVDDEPVRIWTPDERAPAELLDHVMAGSTFWAHNVAFELAIWNNILAPRYGWPELLPQYCGCTVAMAYAMALPGSLDGASAALGVSQQKDMKTHRTMLKMARPRKVQDDGTIIWWDDEAHRQSLYAYCKQDVEVEREIHRRMVNLPPIEWQTWQLDYRINQRGVPIDIEAAKAGTEMVEAEKARLDAEMERVTGGTVKKCTWVNVLTDWLRFRGIEVKGVAKADIRGLLKQDLPDDVRKALQLRQEAGKSSTAKMTAMLNTVSEDNRIRGTLQYHGAHTGRWAGRGIQVHNFPRPFLKPDEVQDAIDLLVRKERDLIELLYGDPMNVASSCLRGMICAPEGREFLCADFSNIEGRKAAWLAGEEWKLQAFRDFDAGMGPDLYKVAYNATFGRAIEAITDAERDVGKVSELSLQFQGGVGAFETMSKNYNVNMENFYDLVKSNSPQSAVDGAREAWDQRGKDSGIGKRRWMASEITKILWRKRHPAIVAAWKACENAAMDAVANPGKMTKAARMKFRKAGSFLFIQLPSGRCICYAYPQIKDSQTPWGTTQPKLTYKGVEPVSRKWMRMDTYGGDIYQSGVQGSSRDIMRDSMFRVERNIPVEVGFTVHDEILTEADKGAADLGQFKTIMAQVPDWAEGLPIAVEGWQGKRYRK